MFSILKECSPQRAISASALRSQCRSTTGGRAAGAHSQWPRIHPAIGVRQSIPPSNAAARFQRYLSTSTGGGGGGGASKPSIIRRVLNLFGGGEAGAADSQRATAPAARTASNQPTERAWFRPVEDIPSDTAPRPPAAFTRDDVSNQFQAAVNASDQLRAARHKRQHPPHPSPSQHASKSHAKPARAHNTLFSQPLPTRSAPPLPPPRVPRRPAPPPPTPYPTFASTNASDNASATEIVHRAIGSGGTPAQNSALSAELPSSSWRKSFRGLLRQYSGGAAGNAAAGAGSENDPSNTAASRIATPSNSESRPAGSNRELMQLLDSFRHNSGAPVAQSPVPYLYSDGSGNGNGSFAQSSSSRRSVATRQRRQTRRAEDAAGSESGGYYDSADRGYEGDAPPSPPPGGHHPDSSHRNPFFKGRFAHGTNLPRRRAWNSDRTPSADGSGHHGGGGTGLFASPPGEGVYLRTLSDRDDVVPDEAVAADPTTIPSGVMQVVQTPPERNVPVPMLAAPIRKLLFTPDRKLLRKELLADPKTDASLPPSYTAIEPSERINMGIFAPFVTSSRDSSLYELTNAHRCKIMGSTSSLTALLSHLQFIFTGFRKVDTRSAGGLFSSAFESMPDQFTTAARKPATVILRRRSAAYEDEGTGNVKPGARAIWGVDNPPHGEPLPNQVLVDLGKIMERWFTLEPEVFARQMLKDRRSPTNPQPQEPHEPSLFVKMNNLMMRSQLDCCDPDMKGDRKVFDLKTRATLPIRLDCSNYRDYTSYSLFKLKGMYNSFEREWYDMARSAFLKFSLQCRIGHMNGVVVAYHNTQQVFGVEYIPLVDMDRLTFGSAAPAAPAAPAADKSDSNAAAAAAPVVSNDGAVLAEKSFARTIRILDDVLSQLTDEFKAEQTVKLTFHAHQQWGLNVYAELLAPVEQLPYFVDALKFDKPRGGKHRNSNHQSNEHDMPEAEAEPEPAVSADAASADAATAAAAAAAAKPAEPVDIFADRYSSALRVDSLSTDEIRAALERYKKSTVGPRAVLASRLEHVLGLSDEMAEAPVEYYRRMAERGYLFKYHIGLTNVLNGQIVTKPFDLVASDKLETTYSFRKLDVSELTLAYEYRSTMVRSRLLHEHELQLRKDAADATATAAGGAASGAGASPTAVGDGDEARAYVDRRRAAARMILHQAAKDHHHIHGAAAANGSRSDRQRQ